MTAPETAFIGLGSNLGDREAVIASGIRMLDARAGIAVRASSSIIETEPVGLVEQGRFLNAVAQLETTLEPRLLLDACLGIEAAHGRDRSVEHRWGPRRLDLDLLLYGDRVIDEPDLTVPHPRLHERMFVLRPLAELAPMFEHPVSGETISRLRDRLAAVPAERLSN